MRDAPEPVDRALARAIERAAALLGAARRVVVTTGAGMSKESGIPTFRDAPNALWARYNPEELATREGFRRNPALVWNWYAERRAMIALAHPHEGHLALARMEPWFDDFLLVTQNIDGLHGAAGSRCLVELHGNIFRYKCFDRDHPAPAPAAADTVPPRCACGSWLRPDVVWFGETLDADDLERAFTALSACDAVLVVGTSGLVTPAAGFADFAKAHGARVIEVNPEPTPASSLADVTVRSGARTALPELAARIEALRRGG